MKKFLGWLGGILAAFITGYAIWYFTVPHTTTFEGMVINGPEVAPLANAIVSVEFVAGRTAGRSMILPTSTERTGWISRDWAKYPE